MEMLIIEGGRPLKGEVMISGSKNASLPIMIATLLSPHKSTIKNVPELADTKFLAELLNSFGSDCSLSKDGQFSIDTKSTNNPLAHYDVVRKMRASVLVLAPLLARLGEAKVSLPGGCSIGSRPVDLHLSGLVKLGANIEVSDGYIIAKLKGSTFKASDIDLAMPSVGATEQLIMACTLAKGKSTIKNAAREPEIVELCEALNNAGADISGAGSSIISINGRDEIDGLQYTIGPDRIEAGTFLALAAATRSSLVLNGVRMADLETPLERFSEAGCIFKEITKEALLSNLLVDASYNIKAVDIETECYPGFPTDMQAQFMAAMCLAEGKSLIYEQVFENRMMHVPELKRMGADITIKNGAARVIGKKSLSAAPVMASDIRASASLVIAALAAKGVSEIRRIYHLDRGYEQLDQKLIKLGAKIKRTAQT